MFLNEPRPVKLADLPAELQQVALNAGYQPGYSEKVFHAIEGCLFYESDELGYGLTMANAMEHKYPRLFADQDVGCTDDALVTGSTLVAVGEAPNDAELLCLKYLYPDIAPGDWLDISGLTV